jgi:hypothetical protein
MQIPTVVPWPWMTPLMGLFLLGRAGGWGGLVVLMLLAWVRYPLVSVLVAAGCFVLMLVCFYDALVLLAPFLP